MIDNDNTSRLLSRAEVEEVFGISRRFLEVHASDGAGPKFVKVGRLVRYRRCDLEDWIKANTKGFPGAGRCD